MLTLSILWVVLAATVIMIASKRKARARLRQDAGLQVRESGRALLLLAVIFGVALLAGFVYVSKFLVSSF
jgi:hypothetical protein